MAGFFDAVFGRDYCKPVTAMRRQVADAAECVRVQSDELKKTLEDIAEKQTENKNAEIKRD